MRLISLIAAMATLGTLASAGVITQYSDRTAFNTAVGPVTLEDFTSTSHFPINPDVLNSLTNQPSIGITPGTIQPGVTYTSIVTDTGNDFNIDAGGGFVGGFLDSLDDGTVRPVTATFDSPVSAFGFDTDQLGGPAESIQINFLAGAPFTATLNPGVGLTFFGFQSSSPDIVSMVLQYENPGTFGFAMDNFAFTANASGPTTPEPASLLLLGAGILGLGMLRRRQGGSPLP